MYQSKRELSEYEFFSNAIRLRAEVTRLAASPTAIPKSHRFLLAVPMAETARSVVHNLVRADAFYPSTPANVVDRKRYMTLAVADCEQLCQDLQLVLDLGLPVGASRMEAVLEACSREIALIKGARKNVRLVGKRTAAERLADCEAEAAVLRELV